MKLEPVNTFMYSSMNMEMVVSILNGIQLTLKDMQIANFIKFGYNFTIRRSDFRAVMTKRIHLIDTLSNRVFEKGDIGEYIGFEMAKPNRKMSRVHTKEFIKNLQSNKEVIENQVNFDDEENELRNSNRSSRSH